jgi:two-component system response regulator RegA
MNNQQNRIGWEEELDRYSVAPWSRSIDNAPSDRGRDKVLIVDDDKLFCRQLATGLKRHGLEAVPTCNRSMAFEAVHSLRPQYAVLELRLLHDPNAFHSGLEVISALLQRNASMRIVVATAYSSIATAIAAIRRGAVDYLLKPAEIDTVATALTKSDHAPSLPERPMGADRLRWEYILRIFFQCNQNVSATARALGMHRRTLQRMLSKRPPPE